MKHYVVLLVLAFVLRSEAQVEPIYFEGTGTGASESLAMSDAFQNAMSGFVKEHFPVQYSVDEEIRQTTKHVIQNSKFRASIGDIELDGIRVETSERKTLPAGGFEVKVKYSVPRSIVLMAKKRLALAKGETAPRTTQINMGGSASVHRGNLIVRTNPPGALVTIDDAVTLPSPIQLNGFLDPGQHKLLIDHPHYLPVESVVNAEPGKTVVLDEKLIRASIELTVESYPSGAVLQIDGKAVGQTPKTVSLDVGRQVELRLDHSDTKSLSRKILVVRDPSRQTLRVALEYHPTFVQVLGPEIAGKFSISLNGKKADIAQGRSIQVDPGLAKICFSAMSKEVQRGIECGGQCCKSAEIKPGRQNLVSFHRELRTKTRVAPIREVDSESIKDVEEVSETDFTEGSAKLTRPNLPTISLNPRLSWQFDMGIDSVAVNTQSVLLSTLGTGLRLSLMNHIYGEAGINFGSGESTSYNSLTKIESLSGSEGAIGISTASDNSAIYYLDYRFGKRQGAFLAGNKVPGSSLPTPETFSQAMNGFSGGVRSSGKEAHGYFDLWFYSSTFTRKELSNGGGVRLRLGLGFDF